MFRRFVSKSMELHFTELVSARTEGLAFGFGRLLWLCLPLRWGEAFLHEWGTTSSEAFSWRLWQTNLSRPGFSCDSALDCGGVYDTRGGDISLFLLQAERCLGIFDVFS